MLLFTGVCLGPHILLAQSTVDGAPLLHLQDALALADSANRQEEITRIGVAQAKASLGEARSYYFPQLKLATVSGVPLMSYSFTIPAGTLGTYQGIGPLPATDSKITSPQRLSAVIYGTAQQPLTQLYKVHLSVGEAQVGVKVANEQLRQTHQDLARKVRESYYSISQAQGQLHATETALTYLKELSVEAKNNLAQQTVLQSDAMTVTANLKNAEYSQAQAEDSLALRKENLNLLLARPLQTPFEVDEDPQPTLQELDLDEAVKEALAQRPELRIAHLQQSQAEFEVRRQKAEYIPDISFGLTYLSFQNIAFFPPNVASVGLSLQWQPIDWGLKKQKLVSLRGSSAQASLKAADVEQQIRLDVDQAFRRLRRSRLQVNAQASALEAEKVRWREAKNQYQQKTILLSDLLNEETAVAQAISHYTDGLTEFWSAKAGFAKALGED
jgi:outer membrane protein TolC